MRIGILSQWFDPEPGPASLPGVLARGLVDRGHDVQVVTGFPNYPTGLLDSRYRMSRRLDERIGVVDVRRVALYPSHDGSVAGRLGNYASFGASAVASGIGAFRGVDAIWVYASPITVSWPLWAARLTMGLPGSAHALDLWPDTLAVLANSTMAGSAPDLHPRTAVRVEQADVSIQHDGRVHLPRGGRRAGCTGRSRPTGSPTFPCGRISRSRPPWRPGHARPAASRRTPWSFSMPGPSAPHRVSSRW